MIVRLVVAVSLLAMGRPHLNPRGPTHEKYAVKCLQQLATQQFKYMNDKGFQSNDDSGVQLLTIAKSSNLTTPAFEIQNNVIKTLHTSMGFNIEVIETQRHGSGVEILTNFYLIVVDSASTFDERFKVLMHTDNYNPKALFLVYYSSVEKSFKTRASTILKKLWKKSVNNAIVLVPKTLRHLILFSMRFSFFPTKHCLEGAGLKLLDHCIDGKIHAFKKYYENNLAHDFRNCTLEVVANQIDPFVINEREGFEVSFVKQLGEALNIFFNITLTGEDSWGVKDDNGSWTHGLKRVYEDSCLGIGNFYSVPDYDKDFEFTVAHFQSDLVWIVPIAQYVPKWRVLTIIFSWYLWILCIAMIVVCAVIIRLTSCSEHELENYKRFDDDFFVSYRVIITAVVANHPKSDFTRIVFVSLSIFSIIISSVYTSSLINYLTRPQREPQVGTIDEVLDMNWDIGGLPVYESIFNVTDDELSMRVYDIFQVNESLNIWLTSVADDRDTSTMTTDFFIKYNLANRNPTLIDADGKPKIFILDGKIFQYSLVIVTNAGFPFLNRLNNVIGWMRMFGLVEATARKYVHLLDRIKALNDEATSVQPLSLDHLQGAFAIVVLGGLFGTISIISELALGFIKKNK